MPLRTMYKDNMDEIVFVNKNKSYGAYVLRKAYNQRLSAAALIAISVFTLGTSLPLIIGHLRGDVDVKPAFIRYKGILLEEPSEVKPDEKTQEVLKTLPPAQSTIKFNVPVVRPDEMVAEEYIPAIEEFADASPGQITIKGQEGGYYADLIENTGESGEGGIPGVIKEETIFYATEEMPMYPGGEQSLMEFIESNLHYPDLAVRAHVEGRVAVEMVIEKSGNVTNLKVIKSLGAGCDEEALRVCRLLRRWDPGRQNGVPVRVRMVIPFRFDLD